MEWLQIIVLVFLVLVSYIDIRTKVLPSFLTTASLFVVAIVNIVNIPYGILGGLLGWLLADGILKDGDFFSGLADLKMTILLGLMVSSISAFLLLTFLICFYGVAYKIVIVRLFPKQKEIAFIPIFLIVYVSMLFIDWGLHVQIF